MEKKRYEKLLFQALLKRFISLIYSKNPNHPNPKTFLWREKFYAFAIQSCHNNIKFMMLFLGTFFYVRIEKNLAPKCEKVHSSY